MTHREIQTATLMRESRVHNGGALSLERAIRIEVCLPFSALSRKVTHTHAHDDLSKTQVCRSWQTYLITHPSMPRDHFQSDCKPDSIPI